MLGKKKMYLVSVPDYDAWVVGIFSSRKKAEEGIKEEIERNHKKYGHQANYVYNKEEDYLIEEYNLNQLVAAY